MPARLRAARPIISKKAGSLPDLEVGPWLFALSVPRHAVFTSRLVKRSSPWAVATCTWFGTAPRKARRSMIVYWPSDW